MSPADRERYSRQILFPGIGEKGQEKLIGSRVAIVGCGALGSFHAASLARAGVGSLAVIDRDYVEPSNLQRQWLFEESDAAEALPKAIAAERALTRINSSIRISSHIADLTPDNVEDLLDGADLVMDGTDNFETRYLINDFCVDRRVPWLYGGAVGSYGIVMPICPEGPCFRCIYPEPPGGVQPTCETAGILNPATAAVAAWQVAGALRLLCGESAAPKILTLDVWSGVIRQVDLPDRDPQCPACGLREFVYLEGKRRAPVSLCGRNAVQIHERSRPLDLQQLRLHLQPHGEVRINEFALRFYHGSYELTVFPDGRAIIKGTTDVGVARSLYARFLGH
ncbi:MAG: ThiF family adenylyltransferase [Bryobacteraceae bacterium]